MPGLPIRGHTLRRIRVQHRLLSRTLGVSQAGQDRGEGGGVQTGGWMRE
jgi:hypothetical protein